MSQLRFFGHLLRANGRQLCRQRALLAILLVLCLCLPLLISPAAELVFSRGVSFSGITLAITAPPGDDIPGLLEDLMDGMEDIRQYCRITAMDPEAARTGLADGSVTAILALPEGFIQGILEGTNPDVELIVPADRPLEALLTLWVGQSATDLLAAFQSGIYGVLELYLENPVPGLSYDQVVSQINLRYITWTLNRQDLFRVQEVSVTGQLPVGLHYSLSLLIFFLLALPSFFYRLFSMEHLASQKRLLAVGQSLTNCWLSAVLACWLLLFAILAPCVLLAAKGSFGMTLACCAVVSLFGAGFVALCCLLTGNIAGCGVLSSLTALLFLALSGGILPPVMLPQILRRAMNLSPVTWLRALLAASAGYDSKRFWLITVFASAGMLLVSLLLYRRRFRQEVDR